MGRGPGIGALAATLMLLPACESGIGNFTTSSGSSAASISAITSLPSGAPASPTGLQAVAPSYAQVNLSWSDNSGGEAGFVVQRAQNAGPFVSGPGAFFTVATTLAGVTSFVDGQVSASTAYYYQVIATNAGQDSAPTASATVTTPPAPTTPPVAPSSLTAAAADATIVDLAWMDNSDNEAGFEVSRSSDGGSTFTVVATTGANQAAYEDFNLDPQASYVYRIRAVNSAGDSSYAPDASVTTLAAGNMATYSYVSVNILAPNCVSCHNSASAAAGYSFDSYSATLRSVNPGNAAGSALYSAVMGGMPPGSPLSSSQISAIQSWIDAGAQND